MRKLIPHEAYLELENAAWDFYMDSREGKEHFKKIVMEGTKRLTSEEKKKVLAAIEALEPLCA
jgi:hypothetical protein